MPDPILDEGVIAALLGLSEDVDPEGEGLDLTDRLVRRLVDNYAVNLSELISLQQDPDFVSREPGILLDFADRPVTDPATGQFVRSGNPITTQEGLRYFQLLDQIETTEGQLLRFDMDVRGNPFELADLVSPDTAARLQADRESDKSRERIAGGARQSEREDRALRDTISRRQSVIDAVDGEIARGEIELDEAINKTRAVVDAATIERGIFSENIGRSVPRGTEHLPGFGPDSNVAAVAAMFGFPFDPIPVPGTQQINPAGATRAILEGANTDIHTGLGSALEVAAQALAGLGADEPSRIRTAAGGPDAIGAMLAGGL